MAVIALTDLSAGAAGYSQTYLLRNVGARANAMAGTYTASAVDPFCLYYNPASLSLLPDMPQFSAASSILDFGRTQTTGVWGQNLGNNIGAGFGLNMFNTAPFTARDVRGNSLGNVSDLQMSLTGGVSYSMEFMSIGMGVKYLHDKLNGSDISADGYAVDFGALINVNDMFDFGLSIQNVSGIMFWKNGNEESSLLPYTIRAGFSTVFPIEGFGAAAKQQKPQISETGEPVSGQSSDKSGYITFGLDAVLVQKDNSPTITIGAEAVPDETVAFRAGFAIFGDKDNAFTFMPGTTWGVGISIRPDFLDLPFRTHIDYSVSKDLLSKDGIGHHVSLVFQF